MKYLKNFKVFESNSPLTKEELEDIIKEELEDIIENSDVNADLNHLDVSNVTNMYAMFQYSQFDGDISQWDVSNVKNMDGIFYASEFNHKLYSWRINLNCLINNNKNIFNKTHIILKEI